jgi:CheY-like chemotaxis protein
MTHVLVVDDAEILGHLLKAAYATLDATIQAIVVPSAEEAETVLQKEAIDLMVIDIHLPGKSGLEMTKKARKTFPQIKIIDISGLNDPNLREKSLAAGADAFFTKPIEMSEFLELSSTYLGLKRVVHAGKPVSEEKLPPAPDLVVDMLVSLRQELSAKEVVLIDHKGQVMAKAGEISEETLLETVIPPLMSASSAGQKISSILSPDEPENVLAFRGRDMDLVLCSIEAEYMLVVVLQHSSSRVKIAVAFDAVASVQHDLRPKLISLGLLTQIEHAESAPPAVEAAPEQKPIVTIDMEAPVPQPVESGKEDSELEIALKETTKKKLKPVEVDSFWDTAVAEVAAATPTTPDLLTYDQADRLGLTPKGNEKSSNEGDI